MRDDGVQVPGPDGAKTNKPLRRLAERRLIGAYYTPADVADVLASWAIRTNRDRIFEPSFGGCEFIRCCVKHLEKFGGVKPLDNLFGSDVDDIAFRILQKEFPSLPNGHFLAENFLNIKPESIKIGTFDVVIGNPPYIRHHDFNPETRLHAKRVSDELLPNLSMQANLWAFFVLHGCSFLREGGRAAWILPHSLLHATYAAPVRDFLQRHFERVQFVALGKRIFRHQGADEGTVVALLDCWHKNSHKAKAIAHARALSPTDLIAQIRPSQSRKTGVVGATNRKILSFVSGSGTPLGSSCNVRIGAVTGDVAYFLFDRSKADQHFLTWASLRPILSKGAAAKGIFVDRSILVEAFDKGWRTAIIDTSRDMTPQIEAYLKLKSRDQIERNVTFAKRPLWHQPLDNSQPDAFLTSMSHRSPRIILTEPGIDCTNSLLRVKFRTGMDGTARRLAALSLVSTFGQLSAEICGRPYGAGLLKHEPSDARKIRIAMGSVDRRQALSIFREVNQYLTESQIDEATDVADSFMERIGLFDSKQKITMTKVLRELRERRISR